jgi:hypothetical protein
MIKRLLSIAVLVACLGSLAGCAADPTAGYSAAPAYPKRIETVSVPIFENHTYVRGIEFELTDALIKEIEARTPYKVSRASGADSVISGHVRKVELDQLSKSRLTGLGEEVIVRVTIDFQWRDLTTETALVDRKSFTGNSLFVPSNPSGERVELGRMAVVQSLARDIVAEMRSAW